MFPYLDLKILDYLLSSLYHNDMFLKCFIQLKAESNAECISFLKAQLAETDYIAAKIAEGSATAADYAEKIAQRKAWRKEISEFESA